MKPFIFFLMFVNGLLVAEEGLATNKEMVGADIILFELGFPPEKVSMSVKLIVEYLEKYEYLKSAKALSEEESEILNGLKKKENLKELLEFAKVALNDYKNMPE